MITAVDSNVLFDVFLADARFGQVSAEAMRRCLREGRIVACEVVWAEVSSLFPSAAEASAALARLGVHFEAVDAAAALLAGRSWRKHRQRGGARNRVAADFLIGAHGRTGADRLLTRDRGFYRDYFEGLRILDPTEQA